MSSDLNLIDVCCAVPEVHLADCQKNREEIYKLIKENRDSAIIVFPELSLTGYTCGDLFFQSSLIGAARDNLLRLADQTKSIRSLIAVGLPISFKGKLYNCACLFQQGKILAVIPKTHIPENREYYEKRWFSSGKDIDTEIDLGGPVPFTSKLLLYDGMDREFMLGVELCEDLWAPDPPSTRLALSGAVCILNLSASNETIAKDYYRTQLIENQSARLNCAYLYASSGYGESTQDLVFSGDAVIAEKGVILAKSERFVTRSFSLSAQIDLDLLLNDRRVQSSFELKDFGYKEIPFKLYKSKDLKRKYAKHPFIPEEGEGRDRTSREIIDIQTMGLGSRVKKLGDTKMVVGVSGGLDSTLSLLIARNVCDKFGLDPKNILAVTMPGFGTTDRTYTNALELIDLIGATRYEIPISDAVSLHFRDIGQNPEKHDATYENAQARERTQILMDLANKEGGIVATYNGDHMSMYGVNAGVPKTLIRHLIRYYARENPQYEDLLEDILNTPVSPELLPPDKDGKIAQKTEEKVGPYELHDFFLYSFLRNAYAPEKIYAIACDVFEGDYSPEEILKWLRVFYRRFFSQQFKRSTLPDGPKVGSVSLSPRGDWRMPTDADAEEFLKNLEKVEASITN